MVADGLICVTRLEILNDIYVVMAEVCADATLENDSSSTKADMNFMVSPDSFKFKRGAIITSLAGHKESYLEKQVF
jgi:hypothetical protein